MSSNKNINKNVKLYYHSIYIYIYIYNFIIYTLNMCIILLLIKNAPPSFPNPIKLIGKGINSVLDLITNTFPIWVLTATILGYI
jgi:hypothetical protein